METHKLLRLKHICSQISDNLKEETFKEDTRSLQMCIQDLPNYAVQRIQQLVLTTFFPLLQPNDIKKKENVMQCVVETLSQLFKKSKIEITQLFFNLYGCLMLEIYDANNDYLVKQISEEYKLSIVNCLQSLFKSISWDVIPSIYVKDNIGRLGPVINLCLKLARNERLRALRIASIELIMIVGCVDDLSDRSDLEIQSICADTFMFYIPGVSSTLVKICLEDEKCGHKIINTSLTAFGRILCLVMQDYNKDVQEDLTSEVFPSKKFENSNDVSEYLTNTKRTPKWYKEHDKKLYDYFLKLKHVTSSQHPKVRFALAVTCEEFLKFCMNTLPMTSAAAVEILIALSEDEVPETAIKCKLNLGIVSDKFLEDNYSVRCLLDHLESNFEANITKIPRIFNGIDELEQLTALNLLIGYLRLFGENKLKQMLFTTSNLNKLILSLLHVAQLETSRVTLLEEYTLQEIIDVTPDSRTPWKVYRFQDKKIGKRFNVACQLLAMPGVADIVLDYLLDLFLNNTEEKKEATLILNEILSVKCEHSYTRVKQFLKIYLDPDYCKLPLEISNTVHLGQVQNNVIQLCLQIEGIGKMALTLGLEFHKFLLKVLYVILENAGSKNSLLAASGLSACTNIAIACGYKSVTELINKNSDYFSFHVICKLKDPNHNKSILDVLTVVMKYSDKSVLTSMSDIVNSVLLDSCDKYQNKNDNSYLRVFSIFINRVHDWLGIKVVVPVMKSREEKEKEIEAFKISNMEEPIENFSDENVMGNSPDDVELEEDAYPNIEEYKKPEPSAEVKITVSILNRVLHFLPAKDTSRKILVLEILNGGVEIISDWEDELLPIVHKIWSPLINRFKEFETPLIIKLSFELLVKLACLSKDFIRLRTVKEVLPLIVKVLHEQAKKSFLKDVGSAYRYTQGYKMQLSILPKLGRLFYDLDIGEINVGLFVDAVEPYLSSKQPKVFQEAAVDFYEVLKYFDEKIASKQIEELVVRKYGNSEFVQNIDFIKIKNC